ncbi:hypothetical protein H0N99_00655 [Candidatus Micrarchaeota archaeon]|nr:hypothetical protein [Candidatus Micrarchaeota archaeon]
MEIGDMLYKNISEIFDGKGFSLGFEFKNGKVIMKVERLVLDDKDDAYLGIKSI